MRGQRATPAPGVWEASAIVVTDTAEAGAYFGYNVDFISSNNNGRVYTLNRAPGGNWTQV